MGRDWFVEPDADKVELTEGEWVRVKRELNYGEFRKFKKEAGISLTHVATQFTLDKLWEIGSVLVLAYAVDWSVKDKGGVKKEITPEVVEAMRAEAVFEIAVAIAGHIGMAAKAKEKKAPRRSSKKVRSSATS